ncbi:TadE/TadG family type IV pilus assembly protein [Kordiimonas sp.]|uniref:TadE/TadG family type IV pilus assembly protein n=1 Tax=Kordiimonas sp. TaxID=1970157 RepID=UPI003A8D2C5E
MMVRAGIRLLRKVKGREDGAAAVEAALGLPLLLAMIVGVLEVTNIYFVAASLENSVLRASRFGITGSIDEGSTREEQVREIIAEQTFGRVDMDAVQIETLVYEQFGDIGEPEPYTDQNESGSYEFGEPFTDVNGNGQWDDDMATAGLGEAGDIVLYRVSYAAPSMTGLFDWATRQVNLSATVAVRNEPY